MEAALGTLQGCLSQLTVDDRVSLGAVSVETIEKHIGAISENTSKISIGVDSGAEISVWPLTLRSEIPLQPTEESKQGVAYWAPGDLKSPSIRNLGTREYLLKAAGQSMSHRPTICEVRRPLMSVAALNDNGWDVHFMAKNGSWAEHVQSETFLNFIRRGGRFELDVEIDETSGFQGHASL